jgi:hypothetical protein
MPGTSKIGGGLKTDKALMKASPEKKAEAKAKAIKGGMPQDVADKVFKMKMGSKSMKNSDSAFSMYSEKVMKMSPLFAHEPGHNDPKDKLYSYSVKTNVKTKTKTLGTQTQKDILKEGAEFKSNRKSKVQAERGAAMDKAQKDSIRSAQTYIKNVQKRRKLTQKDLEQAAAFGDRAGRASMGEAKGEGGNILFDKADIQSAFGSGYTYNRPKDSELIKGYGDMNKRQKKKAREKLNLPTRKVTGYKSAGSLGQVPKLSDLQMSIPDKALKYYNRKK